MEKFYLTTAIYYVNSTPHLGSVSEAIAADVIARYKRLRGFSVFFSTGTDEHSQKIEIRAKEQGLDPKDFVDRESAVWKSIFDKIDITYNRFIRTSDEDHIKVVQDFFEKLYEKGDIYLGKYEGWYCIRDETFLKDSELEDGKCPHCGGEVQKISEDNYFFKLSKYQEPLLRFYTENKEFLRPESRYNEIYNIIKGGLQDVSVTRKSFKFGIPVPFDNEHTIYVWFDALINYITSIGYLSNEELFNTYWPADLHIIGKDITRFHGIVWPAMLMSYGLPLPKSIFAHGFWNLEGAKMSKSFGKVIDPVKFVEDFSSFAGVDFKIAVDVLRYYLSREVNFGLDGDFRMETFFARYNFDLANDYGNLINRTLSMLYKYRNGVVPHEENKNTELTAYIEDKVRSYLDEMDSYQFSFALDAVWSIISFLNNYIQITAPWNLVKREKELDSILYELLEGIRIVSLMLKPFMPNASELVLDAFNSKDCKFSDIDWGFLKSGDIIKKFSPIFPRIEKEKVDADKKDQENYSKAQPVSENVITYDYFSKVDLRVAKILDAERVEKSEKLIKITVSLGAEKRNIIAGIGKYYTPENLIGKKIVIVTNLEPRKLMGIESQGMLLAASDDTNLSLLMVDKDIEEGTKIS